MGLKILWGILFGIWLILVLLGKGGFVHILLLCGISVLMIDLVAKYRSGRFRDRKGPAESVRPGLHQ